MLGMMAKRSQPSRLWRIEIAMIAERSGCDHAQNANYLAILMT